MTRTAQPEPCATTSRSSPMSPSSPEVRRRRAGPAENRTGFLSGRPDLNRGPHRPEKVGLTTTLLTTLVVIGVVDVPRRSSGKPIPGDVARFGHSRRGGAHTPGSYRCAAARCRDNTRGARTPDLEPGDSGLVHGRITGKPVPARLDVLPEVDAAVVRALQC